MAPPTPKIGNRDLTGLALGVWVWVGSHTNWTGVVGCACYSLWRRESQASTQVNSRYLCILAFRSKHFRCAFDQFEAGAEQCLGSCGAGLGPWDVVWGDFGEERSNV